jgi:hypothetical protein
VFVAGETHCFNIYFSVSIGIACMILDVVDMPMALDPSPLELVLTGVLGAATSHGPAAS